MFTNKSNTAGRNHTLFITTAFFLLLALVCLVINYSVDNFVSWALYPAGALVVVWATIVPLLLLKKHKALYSFVGLAITLIPYVFLIQQMAATKGWFMPLALPLVVLFLSALGLSIMAFKNNGTSKYYAMAITVLLFGVVVNLGTGAIVDNFLNQKNANDVARVATTSLSVIVVLFLIAAGYLRKDKAVHYSSN